MNIKKGLVGYWKLSGDSKDYSGKGNHGINHGVNLTAEDSDKVIGKIGKFDGRGSYIEVPNSESLSLATGEFSISTWVKCDDSGADVIGDILGKFDATTRKGFTLGIKASSGGYNSQGNDRHIYFGIDNCKLSNWKNCGRPSPKSNYVNQLTVFNGKLYVGTTDAKKKEDWCHVCRYEGDGKWEDCGRVGDLNTHGIGPMIVHNGELYAGNWNYDWTERRTREFESWDYCRIYRYRGGKEWEDCGQPGKNRRLYSLASYKGRLYAAGDGATKDPARECYVYEGGRKWRTCGEFEFFSACLAVHDGRLYLAGSGQNVHVYDEDKWESVGHPDKSITQIHSMEVYKGKLCVGTWPKGTVAAYREGKWQVYGCTNLEDAHKDVMEINALTVYNGKLYAGTLPLAGVWRYDGGTTWTLLKRLLPAEAQKGSLGSLARLTSLTVYDGKLFASVGCASSSIWDSPCDVRGKVFCIEAGKCISYDYDLDSGWKHIVAVKEHDRLKLYIDGELVVKSPRFEPDGYHLSTDKPLKIGFGEVDYFSGDMREIRVHNRVIAEEEVKAIFVNTKIPTNG